MVLVIYYYFFRLHAVLRLRSEHVLCVSLPFFSSFFPSFPFFLQLPVFVCVGVL